MTKPRGVFKKRQYKGNQHSSHNVRRALLQISLASNDTVELGQGLSASPRPSSEVECSPKPTSTSKKKVSVDNIPDSDNGKDVNIIIDLDILNKAMLSSCMCKICKREDTLEVKDNSESRKGLASNLSIVCTYCNNVNTFFTSHYNQNCYDINIRCVYALRAIGKGMIAAKTFFGILNLPSPPVKFERYNCFLLKSLETIANKSMENAAAEAIELNVDDEGNTSSDIMIGIDGTWQKRGHTSLNGVVTVSCIDTGKILDAEVFSKYCHGCSIKNNDGHECVKNFTGSSGGMETAGALAVFSRSEATRKVRYKYYLGDGDSKGFQKVVQSNPYGANFAIEKLECVGHVQKRIGGWLRKLRREMKGKKLSDGYSLGGKKGRLTDSVIDSLQNYYGLAIRRNKHDLENMKKDVWATFFHKASTDAKPQHGLCSETWCRYKQAQKKKETYHHKNALDPAVIDAIKPTYKHLAQPDLLKKCLHGNTQNLNESFNSVLWSRIPKTSFVGISTLKCGTLDAIITYNDGNSGRIKVLSDLGINPGNNCRRILREIDCLRVQKAEKACQLESKARRKRSRMEKKKKRDVEKQEEPEYDAGMF